MTLQVLSPEVVAEAHKRLAPFIKRTPLVESTLLNQWLGHEILFKAECFQTTGAYKIRGALNTLLALKEQGKLPQKVVAFSSGNHAQAVAWSAAKLGIKATVFMPAFVSKIKQQATRSYGAEVVLTASRKEAEEKTREAEKNGAYLIPPFDHDMEIAGQGTACFEALSDGANPDAIFAPCGGGGLLSGTFLAKQLLKSDTLVFAGEPAQANDATRSYNSGAIVSFPDSPNTIADGAKTLVVAERTFHYLKQLNGFFEVEEEDIIYWTQWLTHLLKTPVEPTSAVAMGAAYQWLATQKTKQRVLVILSGANIAPETHRAIWEKDYLGVVPQLEESGSIKNSGRV
jgi:threonine dehydratase